MKQLLPDSAEGDLAAVCSWADEVRRNYRYRWSSALHYVDTPDFKCNYDYCSKFWFVLFFCNIILHLGFSFSGLTIHKLLDCVL